MKIAISAENDTVESLVDQRFGRCKYFLIVNLKDNEIKEVKAVENQGAVMGHSAGIKAAQQVGELGAEAIITGNIGPNSIDVLNKLGIKAYSGSGVVEETIKSFISNELDEISEIAQSHPETGGIIKTKSEKIFFPLLDDEGLSSKISEHFGHAPFFGVYDVEKKELKIINNNLNHTDPTKSPIDQIEELVDPTTIFAKGIGGRAISIIAQKGLSLKTGDYDTVKEVIDNLDKLEDQIDSCGHEQ